MADLLVNPLIPNLNKLFSASSVKCAASELLIIRELFEPC
jgi:hypothetical protein